MNEPLWQPSAARKAGAVITRFRAAAERTVGHPLPDYDALYAWSIRDPEAFWHLVWTFCGVVGDPGAAPWLADAEAMPGARFFPGARLNFAENLLHPAGGGADDDDAIVFRAEDRIRRRVSWKALRASAACFAAALRADGVGPGDRVAAVMPNMPETIIAMLATACIGAVWSSCSPDFGARGILDRFGQIAPKALIAVESYGYGGKIFDCREKIAEVAAALPGPVRVVMVPHTDPEATIDAVSDRAVRLDDWLAPHAGAAPTFEPTSFDAPLYIMFSSGTTGIPKCIVHGAGGTLLQHLKEHRLHSDVRPGDRVFYFTTCGWMMWNWLASGLASGATLLLYDGSPFHPSGEVLFDFAQEERATFFGTSAKYIDALAKAGLRPRDTHDLSSVRAMASTGSPLAPESFDYVYDAIKPDLCLSSISGGTDIVSCFVLGCPVKPVYRGEIQVRGLGMAVEVWNDEGRPVVGEKGELVCVAPFPSMPIGFWNDPDGSRYHGAYFERFPGVWCHGDYVELTPRGGMVIYGRSDAVLNPGGVRLGTSEIYRQVEQLDQVVESIAVGQDWDNDVRVVLFVRLREGLTLDDDLITEIKARVRSGCTPRHVPARVLQVPDIPRTKSGKIVELAVRDVVHGRTVKNVEALANPEALDAFRNRSELAG